jgi:hypothetical protein
MRNFLELIKRSFRFIHKDIYSTGTDGRIDSLFADTYVSQCMNHDSMPVRGLINAGLLVILTLVDISYCRKIAVHPTYVLHILL